MNEAVQLFFSTFGLPVAAPNTFPELMTWFVAVMVALMLVLGVFRVIAGIVNTLINFGR